MVGEASEKRLVNERISQALEKEFVSLEGLIDGDLLTDFSSRLMYATDASAYRELPLAVCRPRHEADIIELVSFARRNKISLIPRAAGTSLAGQVVGRGMVVDISRHMTHILDLDIEAKTLRVQPGVILDDMNKEIRKEGLFFSPETSTSNRCMIGGMIGNNSSGLHSVVYGSTREHLRKLRMVLYDGSVAEFTNLSPAEFNEKCELENTEGKLYRKIKEILDDEVNRNAIASEFPDPEIVRRNTGYALDELASTVQFSSENSKHKYFNFCRLIAGSEGTLGIITEATLELDPLPPPHKALIPIHVDSVMDAIRGNLIALEFHPAAVELMDNTILDLTRNNLSQKTNRFFVEGSPGAILIVELAENSQEEITEKASKLEKAFRTNGIGYHFPIITGEDIPRVWALRKAGLGVLSGMTGDAKPVSVIEDTSVHPSKLEDYISEFNLLLERYNLDCVYHAHISVGELHLRPVLNLKASEDVKLFQSLAYETALLAKKYKGSLSGEHGDGRLRGEFIPLMVGERVFNLMREIKASWDPEGIFNQGKIIDTPPMNSSLRYQVGQDTPEIDTFYDFSTEGGIIRHIEQCNGSGDCRKTVLSGGSMCPSYMASRDEWNTTRARANILREFIGKKGKENQFDHQEVYEILDLCLSCKACKSECPSGVDMAKLKGEFLQHWYDSHGIPFRTRMIGHIPLISKRLSRIPDLYNFTVSNKLTSSILKKVMGFARERSIPRMGKLTVQRWAKTHLQDLNGKLPADAEEVSYYIDEFTNYNDPYIGITTIKLLNRLGIKVFIYNSPSSGRSYLTKGMLRIARKIALANLELFKGLVNEHRPLLGTEPSAILSFRDEYPDLVGPAHRDAALNLAENTLLLEEYILKLYDAGKISSTQFSKEEKSIKLHGHCQQKALTGTTATIKMLSIPENYHVSEIPSGCCGMAGSFGYEKEHYGLSMKIGELVLFPEVRKAGKETIIAVPGTSCRHQLKDGTGRDSLHPVEILYDALL